MQIIRDDYIVNQRRSTRRLETSLKVLEPAFGRMRACDITLDRLNHYLNERMATGIAPATAKLELTHLHKAFRLAERAGKVICSPFLQITLQNVRTGFFERADFEAVRGYLPEAFKGPITFACLTTMPARSTAAGATNHIQKPRSATWRGGSINLRCQSWD